MPSQEPRTPHRSRLVWRAIAGGVAGLIAVGLWVWLVPSARQAPPSSGPLPASPLVGRPAPDFTLPRLSGGTLALRSLRGRPVVLNFWASWCAPCRAETPLLVHLHKTYGPRGVTFVGVDSEDELADARRFAAEFHVDYPVVQAPGERLMRAYGIVGLPTTVFIGPDGVVRGTEVGGFIGSGGERALIARLDRLLRPAPR